MKTIVLAIDIERSGGRAEHETIAIGASVVDEDLNELDSLFLPGYFPAPDQSVTLVENKESTVFEERCWDEFWSKHADILETLTYKGELSKSARQKEMIELFQEFRAKWEGTAESEGWKLEFVADNNVYDGGFINEMILKHTDDMPIPYNTQGKYKSFWETHSEQRGLLMAVDQDFKKRRGHSKRISEIYNLPKPKKDVGHDHNPANDAYVIACGQQYLLGIRDGRIHLKLKYNTIGKLSLQVKHAEAEAKSLKDANISLSAQVSGLTRDLETVNADWKKEVGELQEELSVTKQDLNSLAQERDEMVKCCKNNWKNVGYTTVAVLVGMGLGRFFFGAQRG